MKTIRLAVACLSGAFVATSAAAAVQTSPAPASAEEIVVTAQRSGIPVWRVDGPRGTLVLVGTIDELAEGTVWNSASLLAALRGADRVMFPASVQYQASLLTALQLQAKSRSLARLPKGHALAQYVTGADYQRLLRLAQRGALRPGFEHKHPRQIVQELVQYAKGERPSSGFFTISKVRPATDPDAFVRSAVHQYRIPLVPVRTARLKPAIDDFFNDGPRATDKCLAAAISLAEAGPTAVTARSHHWAARRVPAVLNSVAQHAIDQCRPAAMSPALTPESRQTVRSLLDDPRMTLAVFDLPLLARGGGLLDELSAAGFEVRGPAWK